VAVERAAAKAAARGLDVPFRVADALDLSGLGRRFDAAIDCGLFHTFTDADRPTYVASLSRVIRPGGRVHILCFSDREPPGEGPRRVTQQEIRDAFRDGWRVEAIRESSFKGIDDPAAPRFSPGGPKTWLATVVREAV
jgi:cyclopropane fatty-acyl-phospholipid synthase-like methyltransferase